VAVKIFRAADLGGAAELQRFRNEAEMVALLDHAGIVPIHEVGTHAGRPYFTIKLIEGGSLADHLERYRADPRSAARLVAAVARAVHHAHQRGVLHRDLKPSNILLDGQGRPHVTDFGLAKRVETDTSLTQSGALVGTPSYMAPEQTAGRKGEVTIATDVYGLGAVLYAVLTGRPPFRAETLLDTLAQVREREPEPPRRLNLKVDRDLETICLKCLEKDYARRYASAEALAEDLECWLRHEPIAARAVSRRERAWRWMRWHKPLVGGAAALLAALLVLSAGLGWVLRDREARRTETERAVNAALKEAARYQQEGRVPEALAAARQAAWLVDRGVADEALRQRVEARRADLEMLADLEEARLQLAATTEEGYDYVGGDRLYAAAFQRAGLDIDSLPVEVVAERIQRSSVPAELAATLADWALIRQMIRGRSAKSWKALLRVARLADPDGWRNQLRDALGRRDKRGLEGLVELAVCKEVKEQLPLTLATLANALHLRGAIKPAEALLRQARQRQPGNFWINHDLAGTLADARPAHFEEAICFYTAAVALRPSSASAHYNLGWALSNKGRLDEAIAEYREALRVKKDFLQAYGNLGNALRDKGLLHEAIAEYREVLRLKKDDPNTHNNLGIALQKKGRLEGAIAEYREALRLKRDFPDAHRNLGLALEKKGLLDEAIAEFRKALHLKKDYPDAHISLGNALKAKGRLDEAIAEYRKALRLKKDFPGAHINLGLTFDKMGRLDEAIAEYRKALRLKKDFPEAHFNLGNALGKKGRLDEAIAEYRKALRLKKDFPEAQLNLGTALYDRGRLDEAMAEYREALRLKKDFPEAHFNLGTALQRKGRLDEAIAEFRKALRLKKDFPAAHYNLGIALKKKGRLDEAIAEYREALRLKNDFPLAHINLGNALLNKGQRDQAIAEYRKALLVKKDDLKAHNKLGAFLHDKGLLDEAIAEYREALRLKKGYPEACIVHYNLGIALSNKGRLDEAIAEYHEALRLKKDYPEAHTNLGNALKKKGLLEEAIAEYRKALRFKKNFPEAYIAHNNCGNALWKKGRLDEAIYEFRAALGLKKDYPEALNNLGGALTEKGRLGEAIDACEHAIHLKEDYAEAHCNLGQALREQGRFAAALEALKRGHELGSKNRRWPYPSAQLVRDCERFVELDKRLPAILSGEEQPANASERLAFAKLCQLNDRA
jgi:tetratricopeptide (TPR) repeat protein